MAIKGSLREASLPDVVQMLALGRKTGILSVTNGEMLAHIYFEEGKLTGADIVNRENKVGELLVKAGKITPEQLDNALEKQKSRRGVPIGEILYEMGLIDEKTLQDALIGQMKETLFNLFSWKDGLFNFEPGESKVKKIISISIKAEDLLLEAARLADEIGVVDLPPADSILQKMGGVNIEELDEFERQVFEVIDNKKTMEEILSSISMDEFETMKAIGRLKKKGVITSRKFTNIAPEKTASKIAEHENLGLAFLQMHMYEEAEREFKRILDFRPDDYRAMFYLSIIRYKLEDYKEAASLIEKIKDSQFEHPYIYSNLAVYYEKLNDLNKALTLVDYGLQRWNSNLELLLNRGIILMKMGRYDDAINAFNNLLKVNNENTYAYFFIALINILQNKIEHALNFLLDGLRYKPKFPEYYNNIARVYEETAEFEKAEEMYKRGLEIDPAYQLIRLNLANFYYKNGYYSLAEEEYLKLISSDYKNGDIFAKLGNIYFKKGNKKEALLYWEESLKFNPDDLTVLKNIKIVKQDYGLGI